MDSTVTKVVVVGGGTAGWLTACLIAAGADSSQATPISVALVESPDIPTIGVGEGTWPTMRGTLERIGLSEADFLLACDASFKQGSRFVGWHTGSADDAYFHPFVPPVDGEPRDVISGWAAHTDDRAFADAVCAQPKACRLGLAPRQRNMPDYAGALNYAYHLDAGKLAAVLRTHATTKLGVHHVRDQVESVDVAASGDIQAVRTRSNGPMAGDLFIDCTGNAALLIGEHYGVPFVDRSDALPNDRALAVQVPVAPGSPIASQTDATAHAAGWIWDIGLPTRRGVGCVYASQFATDEEAAATLFDYLRRTTPGLDLDQLTPRRLTFRSGHRERFWERNCLAVGLSAGFLEPLEASAIVLIELSVNALLDNFPGSRDVMDIHAARFNALFLYRWGRIVEFLKLHYVLSRREEPYWRAHRDPASIPIRLADLLRLWQDQPPSLSDFPTVDEIFSAASHQYVLYGMNFAPPGRAAIRTHTQGSVASALRQVDQRARVLAASLPTNRAYLDALRAEQRPIALEVAW